MNDNIWQDEQAMTILQEAKEKLQALGAVCELTPAGVPGEGVVAALFCSSTKRGLSASLVAQDLGVERAASESRKLLDTRIEQWNQDREVEASMAKSAAADIPGTSARNGWRNVGVQAQTFTQGSADLARLQSLYSNGDAERMIAGGVIVQTTYPRAED
ncbi:hypothetical protein QRD43_21185 [Pelomonas sp. APW6]|uniref:Uncharacterized protein n=1 Tax=Roseateles subflavus TaxID=3053353 RepID=A0ABT7LNH7_9BURK|nr:hypothetical protein [Pelomonas sp. APW6]MDL5034431.1 hypothetical protein [Pelomonas sp. APW6]